MLSRLASRLPASAGSTRRLLSRLPAHLQEASSGTPPPSSSSSSSSSGGGGFLKVVVGGAVACIVGGGAIYALSQRTEDQEKVTKQHRFGSSPAVTASSTSSSSSAKRTAAGKREEKSVSPQLTALLRAGTHWYFSDVAGVSRVEVSSVGSNSPIEDRATSVVLSDNEHVFAGVFDGHGGWKCAEIVSTLLPSYVDRALSSLKDKADYTAAAEAITHAYLDLDEELCHDIAPTAVRSKIPPLIDFYGEGAVSGACACAAIITRDLVLVANTGDSRAVLGVQRADGNWGAAPLSDDQTADTPSEVVRIRREHPGEENTCVVRGRVLGGLQPSRSFGDARYKWSKATLEELGVRMSRNTLTPPYVTAQPVVSVTKRMAGDKFIVLATDGLWDVISSEDAVRIVGEHLASGRSTHTASGALVQAAIQAYANESTAGNVDKLLAIPAPESRNFRDDITVSVVFLDNNNNSGDVEHDPLASALPLVELSSLSQRFELSHDAHVLQTQGPDALTKKVGDDQ